MATSKEVAAAILVKTLADHHPTLQAMIREEVPDPRPLAQLLVPFYRAMLEEVESDKAESQGAT
jgi:hypothetical protein